MTTPRDHLPGFWPSIRRWFCRDVLGFFQEMRWSYLPPLMVYFAAGVSGFTGIIESFFVKEQLGLSAAFLAGLGFWAGLPWALKMPVGGYRIRRWSLTSTCSRDSLPIPCGAIRFGSMTADPAA